MRIYKPLLMVVGVISAAIAWSLSASAQRVVGPLPASVADLTTARDVEIRDVSNAVIVKGTFVKKTDKASEIELAASLSGAQGGEGKAEIELEKPDGRLQKQEIEVTVKRLHPQTTFKLYVDGSEIATFTTNRKGAADLKFTSKHSP